MTEQSMSVSDALSLLQSREYYEVKPHKAQGDLLRIIDALSSPPTDDVREALLAVRDEIVRNGGRADAACLATLEILASRVTVTLPTPSADDVRELISEARRFQSFSTFQYPETGLVRRLADALEAAWGVPRELR